MSDVSSSVTYAACPKCGHAPLPREQACPAACPACGIVLAKFKAARMHNQAQRDWRIRQTPEGPDDAPVASDSLAARVSALLFHVPPQVLRLNWQGRIIVLAVLSSWTWWIFRDLNIPEGNPGSGFFTWRSPPFTRRATTRSSAGSVNSS